MSRPKAKTFGLLQFSRSRPTPRAMLPGCAKATRFGRLTINRPPCLRSNKSAKCFDRMEKNIQSAFCAEITSCKRNWSHAGRFSDSHSRYDGCEQKSLEEDRRLLRPDALVQWCV